MTWKSLAVAFISGVAVGSVVVTKSGERAVIGHTSGGEEATVLDTWKRQSLYDRMRSRPNWFKSKDE